MNTELKNRTEQIVTQIKQQLSQMTQDNFKLTQDNEVLRHCWEKEQMENEESKQRIRRLLEENAALRCQIEDMKGQILLMEQGFYVVDTQKTHEKWHFDRRVHNKEDASIFVGNQGHNKKPCQMD